MKCFVNTPSIRRPSASIIWSAVIRGTTVGVTGTVMIALIVVATTPVWLV